MAGENNKTNNAWMPSVVGAASHLGGNVMNQIFAEHNRRQNFYYNEKAAENADQRTRELYEDLYSPQAQMKMIKEAGLSPSLYYQNAGGTAGQSGAQSQGINGAYPSAQVLDPLTFAQIANLNADTKKKEEEADNIDKDTELKGQQIINIIADTDNKKITNRVLSAEADLAELEYSVNVQTAQATIRMAYSNSEKAAAEARSLLVKADLDEATFDAAYQMAYANLDSILTDTALSKMEINLKKEQIKEISERVRKSMWETWQIEKEQNRKDAEFKFDQAKLKAQIQMWATEQNIELTGMKLDMVSDLLGYATNIATCGMTNATKILTKK